MGVLTEVSQKVRRDQPRRRLATEWAAALLSNLIVTYCYFVYHDANSLERKVDAVKSE